MYHWSLTLICTLLGGYVLLDFVRAIKSDPKDRVLLFEILALVIFVLGAFVINAIGFSVLAVIVWLSVFFSFLVTAVYFGISNWRHRRSQRDV